MNTQLVRILLPSLFFLGACGGGNVDFEICDNNIDDEGDGLIDCADAECSDFAACIVCGDGVFAGDEECDDGNNDNGDGCAADCTLEETTLFVSAEDINGEQPDQAVFSVFGEGDFDTDSDGIVDSHALVIVSSDNSDICNLLEANTLGRTASDLINDGIDGQHVITSVLILGSTEPLNAGTIVGDFDQNGDILVDSGFQSTVGGNILADTLFGGAGDGTLEIITIDDFVLEGSYDGVQGLDRVSGNVTGVALTGNFVASRCPAIDVGVSGLAQVGYQL